VGQFDGRVAVITAAAGAGIGQAVARKLASEGARLVISDIHPRRLAETAQALQSEHKVEVLAVEADVTNRTQVDSMVEAAIARFGRIDILHNNAGFNKLSRVWEMDDETWHRVIDINLTGTFFCTRAVLPHMIRQQRGVIVNMSSMHGYSGGDGGGESHYAAAKAAILGFTKAVALETGKYGIRVVALAPGLIENPFLHRIYPEEFFKNIVAGTPLGRAGNPADVANLIAFLCSDDASFITGEAVSITGGYYNPP
jgi:3-oxoacyl-[acyl-carrier protein] reductase